MPGEGCDWREGQWSISDLIASAAVSCRCPLQEITSHSSINSPRQKTEKLKVRWSKRARERYRCQICVDLWVAVEVMKFNCVMLYLMFTKYKPRIQNRTNRSSCCGYSIVPNASTLSKACPIINMDGALFSCVLAEYEIGVPPGRVGIDWCVWGYHQHCSQAKDSDP